MSPKQTAATDPLIVHSQENLARGSNIKNIYIQKINSLMKMSKDTIGKSEIEALNQTNRKKIKKHLSEAEKNNIRLEKNRQSAKKARERKKIYVKLLEQEEKKLKSILYRAEQVERVSSAYVEELQEKQRQAIETQGVKSSSMRHRNFQQSNDFDENGISSFGPNKQSEDNAKRNLQNKLKFMQNIIRQLTELSKYAYWKSPSSSQNDNQHNSISEQQQQEKEDEFFNIEEVLADIEVVHMKKDDDLEVNLDELLNVKYEELDDREEEYINDQKETYDVKSLIVDQYEIVSRCLHQLGVINEQAEQLLKSCFESFLAANGGKTGHTGFQHTENPQLTQFRKINTSKPSYEIKKVNRRRIDSFNSLSSCNRSVMGKRSLFEQNNYFINMEEAESKILQIDRAVEEIRRILMSSQNEDHETATVGFEFNQLKQEDDS